MTTRSVTCCLLTLALLAPLAAPAQTDGELQWYAVEMVLFDQRAAIPDDDERWPVSPDLPAVKQPLVPVGSANETVGFRSLAREARQLNGIRRKLADTNGYQILAHVGWRQPGLTREAAPGVALPLDWQPPRSLRAPTSAGQSWELPTDSPTDTNPFAGVPSGTRLFGTLRAYRERYLHVQLDLRFAPDGMTASARAGSGERSGAVGAGAETTTQPSTYVVRQQRRLRSDEIHYIDHPAVGAIAMIRPVQAPADATAPPPEVVAE